MTAILADILVWPILYLFSYTLLTRSCDLSLAEQRRGWQHVELDVLHPPHHHRLLLHAQPGSRCTIRVLSEPYQSVYL